MSSIMSSKALTKNDVEDRFVVPVEWFDQIWPGQNWRYVKSKVALKVVHQVTLNTAIRYDFVLSTSPGKNAVFDLKGWSTFAGDNKLREDDVVYFGRKAGQNYYTIMVERKFHVLK